MILRRKRAMPNLLRFKNSVFRRKLYKRIRGLERRGRHDEIYRMLKELHEYDTSAKNGGGDGPRELVEEVAPARVARDVMVSDDPFEDSANRGGFKFGASTQDEAFDASSDDEGVDVDEHGFGCLSNAIIPMQCKSLDVHNADCANEEGTKLEFQGSLEAKETSIASSQSSRGDKGESVAYEALPGIPNENEDEDGAS